MQKLLTLFLLSLFSITLSAKNLDLDKIVANTDGKPVLLFFHKPHCGHCKRMIKFTLGDEEVHKKIREKFVYVDIYTADEGEVRFNGFKGNRRALAKSLGYDFYPTSLFYDSHKKMIMALPGARKKDFFIKVLNYISSKQYLKIDFENYLDILDLERDD